METIGALRYNLLYASNNLFGLGIYSTITSIQPECADKYSDAVLVNPSGSGQYIADIGDETVPLWQGDPSTDVDKAIFNALYNVTSWRSSIIDDSQAEEMNSELNLFGMSLLPWDKYSIKNAQGQWVYIHSWVDTEHKKMLNPLRREVLMTKAMTVAKVGVVGAGLYYGSKYAYKKLKL